jgi:hypothetical protein
VSRSNFATRLQTTTREPSFIVPTNRRKILLAMTDMLCDAIEGVSPGECQMVSAASDGRKPSP